MRIFSIATITALSILLASQAALATPPGGTKLTGTIEQSINTAHAYVGQEVEITSVSAPSAGIYGARMYGRVTHVVRAAQGRAAQLRISMNTLRLRNGETYRVNAVVTGIHENTKSNALKEAAGALGGMLIGNALGKMIFHASGGGLAGAAAGFLLAKNNRENMVVPAGSSVSVLLETARRQASRPH